MLNSDEKQIKVRLYGIDSPEKKQAYGEVARKCLAEMVAGKNITVIVYDIDSYGRSVGLLSVDGLNVNKEMVTRGYAWVYNQYNKLPEKEEWLILQEKSKIEKKGLWKDLHSIPPWEFRKNRKRKD